MMHLWPRSIRGKTVLGSGLAIAVFGLGLGTGAYVVVTQAALTSAYSALESQVGEVSDQLAEQDAGSPSDIDLEALRATSPTLVQVVTPDGAVLVSSPGLAEANRICPQPITLTPTEDRVTLTIASGSGRFLRASDSVSTSDGSVVVCAITSDQSIERAQEAVLHALLIALPLLVVGVCVVGWLAVGRALRAVDDMTSQAEAMQSTADGALRVRETHDEIERLGHTLNALLARLHHQTKATRQFVADAGHELRNPLSTLRVTLEFAEDADEASLRSSVGSALGDLARLEELVQDLLLLAKSDATDEPVEIEGLDLAVLVSDAVSASRRSRPDLEFAFEVQPCAIRGHGLGLRSLAANLLDNASRHARTSVSVRLAVTGSEAVLYVDDDGEGLRAEDCEAVFERFVRLDESRDRDEGGSGLGLSIVSAIAEAHGGRAYATPRPGGHFVVTLPLTSLSSTTPGNVNRR